MADEQTQEVSTQQKSGMNPLLLSIIVIVALLLGAGMLFLGDTSSNQTSQPASSTTAEMPISTASSNETITVEGGAFYFKPNEIRVKVGQLVTIKLDSVASDKSMVDKKMKHDFVIDELNVQSAEVEEGVSTTFTFTPTEKGEYEFYCSIGEHRTKGMFGKLIVEE